MPTQRSPRRRTVLGEVATENADLGVSLFSALSRRGVGDAAEVLHGWVHAAAPAREQAGDAAPPPADAAPADASPADPAA